MEAPVARVLAPTTYRQSRQRLDAMSGPIRASNAGCLKVKRSALACAHLRRRPIWAESTLVAPGGSAAGDVGGEEVDAVSVEVASGAVVLLGGSRVGVLGEDLGRRAAGRRGARSPASSGGYPVADFDGEAWIQANGRQMPAAVTTLHDPGPLLPASNPTPTSTRRAHSVPPSPSAGETSPHMYPKWHTGPAAGVPRHAGPIGEQ